jgi:dTDP-glucose pyrophosphorylase
LTEEQRRIASQGIKALMPVVGEKTMLELIVERLYDAGFTDICLVIGPEHDAIREFCSGKELAVDFAVQQDALGTADAVLAAENLVFGNELFLVVNSDNLYPVESLRRLRLGNRPALLGFEREALIDNGNIPEERIAKFATLEVDGQGYLAHIVEKPDVVEPDWLVSMNAWLFSPMIFEGCRTIEPSVRGEYEIAAAVQYAIDKQGERFFVVPSSEGVLDLSSRADIENVRRFLESD